MCIKACSWIVYYHQKAVAITVIHEAAVQRATMLMVRMITENRLGLNGVQDPEMA